MKHKLKGFLSLQQVIFIIVLLILLVVFFAPTIFGERKPKTEVSENKNNVEDKVEEKEDEDKPSLDDFR